MAEIKEKESSSRSSERDYAKDKVAHDKLQAAIKREQKALGDLHYQEGQEEALVERKWVQYGSNHLEAWRDRGELNSAGLARMLI